MQKMVKKSAKIKFVCIMARTIVTLTASYNNP